jgi:methyl-accepting chemotaxis protein
MPNLKDAQELTAPLEELTRDLKSELNNTGVDFDRLVQIADEIAEQADGLAETFGTMNETLMERIKTVSSSSRKVAARAELCAPNREQTLRPRPCRAAPRLPGRGSNSILRRAG